MAADAFTRIDDRWSLSDLPVVVLENRHLRVVICPALGARILHFEDRATGTDMLWHNPDVAHRPVSVGASYDDNFAGGWDELFPNDLEDAVGDVTYPDHGELWSQPWTASTMAAVEGEVTLHLSLAGTATTATVEKWLTLRAGESQLRMRHRITNTGARPLDFLWKLHPALAIDEGDTVDVPGQTCELVDPSFGRTAAPARFAWPHASQVDGSSIDLRVVPALDGTREFVYVRDLTDGWCALHRRKLGMGFGLVFPVEVFSSVWLFMTFGGWRGHSTVVLEPCTTVPKDLNEAIRAGSARRLAPGESLECTVRAILFVDQGPLTGFTEGGLPLQ